MQVDMHYYGTYAMARAAGLKADACKVIATSAEFVDDNAKKHVIVFADGARFQCVATAHHTTDIKNLEPDDQRQIWVPFHFLPGNEGDHYLDRLVCTKDSQIAREMVQNHLDQAQKPYALELLGITAHVYADTFSHYGFSGISAPQNNIDSKSLKLDNIHPDLAGKATGWLKRYATQFASDIAEVTSAGLGHGAALTYPDQPYLMWSYKTEKGKEYRRNNYRTFSQACEKLHDMFSRFAKERPDLYEDGIAKKWTDIKPAVGEVLSLCAEKDERALKWREYSKKGEFFQKGEDIPVYSAEQLLSDRDNMAAKWTDSSFIVTRPIYKFYQAASYHRQFILRELLPKHELIVA